MFELSVEIAVLLFFVALLAGCIDAIAGGGGMLTLPVMVMVGMPPIVAIATNKLQVSAGALSACYFFHQRGLIDLSAHKIAIFMTFIGALLGSWLVLQINAQVLVRLLPILLVAVAFYFMFAPNLSDLTRQRRMGVLLFSLIFAPLLGGYDGFFGPGTGSLMVLAFVALLGYGLTKASAHARLLNCTSNLAALIYFVYFGEIAWLAGLVMMAGQLVGANVGARLVLKNGAKLIKPILIVVCLLMSFGLWFKAY